MFGRPIAAARAVHTDTASPPSRRPHARADSDRFPPQLQIACHTSPLDDIHTPAQRNKLSGKAIAGPLGTGNQRPLTGPSGTHRAMDTAKPHRHPTPPTLRADPGPPPGPPSRGAAPTGPHPHRATSSPQPTASAPRAPPIGTARHPNGTPRHSPPGRHRSPRSPAAPPRRTGPDPDGAS